ncbi:hypothetical protein [Algibacter mikhailovii]|uniref:Uncharacterized protein n=1 Tax=Algibacter mikhailovii TaxID=425498 RepID=A0A918R820_9FLAO|nr:hypothetical protein [Algibacter mikhailovii]GGZ87234.1 hypothetical protein GCM10007028_26730 [Algibacter mikhailovii]
MKLAFGILLIIHGAMHLMGFATAIYASPIPMQALGISKPIGTVWLITFILFIVSATQLFNNKKWFYIAFIAVLMSQVLIILAWKEAKYNTIANCIIVLVSISALANNGYQ